VGPVRMYTRMYIPSRDCATGRWNYAQLACRYIVVYRTLYSNSNQFLRKGPVENRLNGGILYIHDTKCQSEKSPGWFMVALNGRKTLMNIFFSIKMRRVFPLTVLCSLSLSARLDSRIVAHWSILSVLLSPQRPSFPFRRLNAFLKWPKKKRENIMYGGVTVP